MGDGWFGLKAMDKGQKRCWVGAPGGTPPTGWQPWTDLLFLFYVAPVMIARARDDWGRYRVQLARMTRLLDYLPGYAQ